MPTRGKKNSLSTQNLIAIFGVAATIIVAVISGVFNNLNTRTQIDRPIMFTQTAESKLIISPTSTATPFQPNTSIPPTPTPTLDLSSVLSIKDDTECPNFAFPDYLFSGSNAVQWLKENGQAYFNEPVKYGLLYTSHMTTESLDTGFHTHLLLTNKSDAPKWLKVEKDVEITITYVEETPDITHILEIYACGGGGNYRGFIDIPLRSDFTEYNFKAISTDTDDYLKFEPGEPEVYQFHFICKNPGMYHAQFFFSVTDNDQKDLAIYSSDINFICPQKAILYHSAPSDFPPNEIFSIKEYEWTGSEFREIVQ